MADPGFFYFDSAALQTLADKHRAAFVEAAPFPHVVLDDFLPSDVAARLEREFPGPDARCWQIYGPGRTWHTKDRRIEKLGCDDEREFPPFTRHVLGQMNSSTFLRFLTQITGIAELIPDPNFSDCGLHSTGPGGKLMVHTDASRHPIPRLHQRLNAILFLNGEWKEEYGGHLELWDESQCRQKILPTLNRLLIFDTGSKSFHGHPYPLACPPERRRNSLAVYYYTLDRAPADDYAGWTPYVHWKPLTRADRWYAPYFWLKVQAMRFVPPILFDGYRMLKRRKR